MGVEGRAAGNGHVEDGMATYSKYAVCDVGAHEHICRQHADGKASRQERQQDQRHAQQQIISKFVLDTSLQWDLQWVEAKESEPWAGETLLMRQLVRSVVNGFSQALTMDGRPL